MSYIDGFVIAVPTANKEKFIAHARLGDGVFLDLGAIRVVECWGDDVPDGKLTSFPMAVKLKEDETVVFGWIIWPDKATRNAGMEKMMKDPRTQADVNPIPFDGLRMVFGGFELLVQA